MRTIVRIGLIPFQREFRNLARHTKQALHPQDRGSARHYRREELSEIRGEAASIADKLGLPAEVKKRADAICSDATAKRLDHGVTHPVLAAASLYVGCRETKIPVTLRDLAEASGSDVREVGKCYVALLNRMHISRPDLDSNRYVYHISLKRPVSDEVLRQSQETIRYATLNGLCGRNPMTLAAASLYLACCSLGENVTQAELAEAAGIGEESVRECCKAIRLLPRPKGHRPGAGA
ncbi:MAG TPA: transcription initiation factor IIB family protein [Nitrososphaerales archaeon]|nr:transcription initiation factor IIB family protein [Nitrososphaerales archaeon]